MLLLFLLRRQILRFTSRWKYSEGDYETISTGDDIESVMTQTEAANSLGVTDSIFVMRLSLDPAEVVMRYERVALMDYMSQIGGVAFFSFCCIAIIRCCTTDRCFRIEKTFIPSKSAFERLYRKKKEELEYYHRMLLINPRVAADAGIDPKQLKEYLHYKMGEELARFVKALEEAFPTRASGKDAIDPLRDVRFELRAHFGDQVMSGVNFAYSSDTVEVDENNSMLTKIINIITAEKLSAQIEEITEFVKHADAKMKKQARLSYES